MRNIFLIQLETKVALIIIAIVIAIFLSTLYKSVNDFNKFIDQINIQQMKLYEEIRVEKSP